MKIGKYISELLFENDFVILPEIGEFSTKYIPAKFIPELRKVESPSKLITFNDRNKTGGGLLTEYIANKENISSIEAKQFVDNFVAEMQNSLKSGKKVELESVGVFSMDQGGNINFDPDTSVNYLVDSAGMSSVTEPIRKTEDQAKTELDKVMEETGVSDEEPKEEEPEVVSEPVRPVEDIIPPVEEPLTPAEEPMDPVDERSRKDADNLRQYIPEPPRREPVTPIIGKRSGSPVRKGGLSPALKWVAFTVVPLLIIIIILALNYDYIFGDKSVIWKRDAAQPAPVVTTPGTVEEPVTEPAPVVEETTPVQQAFDPTVPPPAPEAGRRVYYIIVGSFEEEHSAIILAEQLREKGARTASVFPIRQGFYRVSYGYYYDLREAERELVQAQTINENAWILHR
jgi:nucleoid DNA-binding protein